MIMWRLTSLLMLINLYNASTSECPYQCRLSFLCWLDGGHHRIGCGNNKWLFSCCETNDVYRRPMQKIHLMPKSVPKNLIRRRIDFTDESFNSNCGVPHNAENILQKRIIGGRQANFAEYPWVAHIRISEYQCGGVLVARQFIATAAHCIQNAMLRDITVYLGELDTQNSGSIVEPLPAEEHSVSQKIVHPRFRLRLTQPDRFDIALLRLTKPAGYKSHIRPICLPRYPMNLVGRNAIISGWGKTTQKSFGQTGTNILQTALVPIITKKECIRWHQKKKIHVELFEEMFCAGHKNGTSDACLGDSGGGLVIYDRGQYSLVGVTSAGFGCGVDHQPGIYHNVQRTLKWIQSVIHQ